MKKVRSEKHKKSLTIPFNELPEGTTLCIRNCIRHYDDARFLIKNNRYQTAMVSLFLAIEEFSKILLLMKYYKMRKPIPNEVVREYFREHKVRLKEFEKYFSESVRSKRTKAEIDGSAINLSVWEQRNKEKFTYVDWNGVHWITPDYYELDKPEDNRMPDEVFYKMKFFVLRTKLESCIKKLTKDPYFQPLVTSVPYPVPTRRTLFIIEKFLKEKGIKFDSKR